MFEVNGETRHLGIIGYPVEHSYSPKMHNYISESMGNNYVYSAYCVKKEDLKSAIEGIKAMGFSGVNVTAPHKFEVMQYIDVLSPKAKLFQSVNTVVNKDGILYGYNTDADGFYASLKRKGCNITGKDVLILGAGGASQPVVLLFASEGAKSITVINRTRKNAEKLAGYVYDATGFSVDCDIKLKHYDVIINTTSAGMYPNVNEAPQIDMSLIDETSYAADMIYNPEETLFLKRAKEAGAKTLNGLGMLIYQGIIAYELFTGQKLGDNIFDKILKNVFGK